MNKNLEIYEETFNEEVSLRLKFEDHSAVDLE